MEKLEFKVGAKAAQLIGRENIAAVDGALIELVKNAYDADAQCVYIQFNMPFPNIPKEVKRDYLEKYLTSQELEKVLLFYELLENESLLRKDELTKEEMETLETLLYSKNEIIVIDNGIGMTKDIIKNNWMNIAISEKEKNMYSPKGRIKTGAKGIGRFALEKLSMSTKVYSKADKEDTLEWNINWRQFDEARLLNDIKATLEEKKETYQQIVEQQIGTEEFKKLRKFNWSTGTMIIMNPTREEWNERLFLKVNKNMQSINPLGSVDTFEIYIKNTYNEEFNFISNNLEINDFDYRIKAQYDGKNKIKVLLKRNEVDLNKTVAKVKKGDKQYEFDLKEFWDRKAFKDKDYHKEDFEREVEKEITASKEIKSYDIDKLKNVGPFSVTMYFLKRGNSEESIIKKIKVNERKELTNKFSGIKIYRDKFKVRPYGEQGDGMYDWLDLGLRSQKSPAGPGHPSGRWRVYTNQLIGYVEIGRNENPKLLDMANREGLSANDEYYIFVQLIQSIIDSFEYDRQYIYREYGKWTDEKIDEIDKSEVIAADVVAEKEEKQKKEQKQKYEEENDQYTKEEYRDTVYRLIQDRNKERNAKDIFMSFSSAGIITNTFAHEFRGIETNVATNVEFIKRSVMKLLNGKEYTGEPEYNPYNYISEEEDTNKLLKSWITVILNGTKRKSFDKEKISLSEFVEETIENWNPLMKKKRITIEKEVEKELYINIPKIELNSIFNNFFLNSADFLINTKSKTKKISIKIVKNNKINNIEIYLENNGPKLDEKYKDNPDKIFEIGETTKGENGTGLGLWIMREMVQENSGEIYVMDKEDGFGIKINIPI